MGRMFCAQTYLFNSFHAGTTQNTVDSFIAPFGALHEKGPRPEGLAELKHTRP